MNDNRIPEIRAVLDKYERLGAPFATGGLTRIRAILDSAPPAPRVFLPGDTVPAGVTTMTGPRTVVPAHLEPWKASMVPYVEVSGVLTRAEWQAAVDRAKAEREAQS